ncbi:hypothetical protein EDB86DRAFT_2886696 [Lactarius hatsudake]|nr:hypothetical protein EDB86DRAFT_2886696 [Lactarius hatsudake]
MASSVSSRLSQQLRFLSPSIMSAQYTPRLIGAPNTLGTFVFTIMFFSLWRRISQIR